MIRVKTLCLSQSNRFLCVGTNRGFKIFTYATNNLQVTHSSQEPVDISLMALESGGNTLYYVTTDKPRVLVVYDLDKQETTRTLNFTAHISAIDANKKILIVKVSSRIHVFTALTVTALGDVIVDVDADSPAHAIEGFWIAYPNGDVLGSVGVKRMTPYEQARNLFGFTESISALAFSRDLYYLAVASLSGKIIRVFSVQDEILLFRFVRGLLRATKITSMAFFASDLLAVSSETESVHIFPLLSVSDKLPAVGWWDMLTQTARSSMRFLPIDSAHLASQPRSLVTVRLPCGPGNLTKVLLTGTIGELVLHVASASGWIYSFTFSREFVPREIFKSSFHGEVFWGLDENEIMDCIEEDDEDDMPPRLFLA